VCVVVYADICIYTYTYIYMYIRIHIIMCMCMCTGEGAARVAYVACAPGEQQCARAAAISA